jgi:carboxyl-terminal processing protease
MLKRPLIIIALATAVLGVGFFSVGDTSFYSKMGRSMDAFGAVPREISTTYVDEVEPQVLLEAGIEGMLDKLDPYTVYVPSEDKEELELISSGIYTGFGITVASRDSMLLITNVRDDYPAHKAGVRIGDRLLSIAGFRVDTLTPKELRRHTRGKEGELAELKLLREGRADTIIVTIARAEMIVENVAFSDVLPGDIGYIRLSRFSRYAPMEVRRHIGILRERAALKGLILDLRDNPGGLLDAAIGIVETFVPRGSVIVSTKSRDPNDTRTVRSENNPLEPTLPLAVLINERSASASEVVAGALQDLDRGIVVG